MVCCIKESSETKGRKINELEICKRVFSSVYLCRNSLQSVYILDGLMDGYPVPYISQTDEDPFVMLAWRCNKLQDFSLIGELVAPYCKKSEFSFAIQLHTCKLLENL